MRFAGGAVCCVTVRAGLHFLVQVLTMLVLLVLLVLLLLRVKLEAAAAAAVLQAHLVDALPRWPLWPPALTKQQHAATCAIRYRGLTTQCHAALWPLGVWLMLLPP